MVRVAVLQRLPYGLLEARQIGLAGPIKIRQWLLRTHRITVEVFRHMGPVDATHILPPTEDLANEAFDRRNGCVPLPVGLLSGIDDLAGMEQFQIERSAEERMVEPRLIRPHGVLIVAEGRQAFPNEFLQIPLGFLTGDRPGKRLQGAGMVRKSRFD